MVMAKTGKTIVVGSFPVAEAEPPPETVAEFVPLFAVLDTSTVRVMVW